MPSLADSPVISILECCTSSWAWVPRRVISLLLIYWEALTPTFPEEAVYKLKITSDK